MTAWHTLSAGQVVEALGVDPARGLDPAEVERRLAQGGPNALAETARRSPLGILWQQFTSTMSLVLLAAAAVSLAAGGPRDAAAILAVVVLFSVLGFIQEFRAERAMAALRKLTVPLVRVRRRAAVEQVGASDLVPGDVVLLEAGNMVPADCRILECASLRIQESALTGESEPVEKTPDSVAGDDVPLGDRRAMAFMGTAVTYGRATAVVAETGMRTELGRVAAMLETSSPEMTPLGRRLDRLGKTLGTVALVVAALVFALGLLRGEPLGLMVMTAIGVAVAAIPEGLPAVVTITLALGAQRMLRRNALIRMLPAVETLGSVTVICSDKTGTLTENRMTVVAVDLPGLRLSLPIKNPLLQPRDGESGLETFFACAVLCNDAAPRARCAPGKADFIGDPTEVAFVEAAESVGLSKVGLDAYLPRIAEAPFDSDRKRMMTVHKVAPSAGILPAGIDALVATHAAAGGEVLIGFAKGAVDAVLSVSSRILVDGYSIPLDDAWRNRIRSSNDELASRGMRVLGVAFRLIDELEGDAPAESFERELTFVGLAGMIDPPRPEVKEAVASCRAAGVRPVMITGDHPMTALAVARELGIAEGDWVLTGAELSKMTQAELDDAVERTPVFARVAPEHKFQIVEALKRCGHVVAMTGDGVNDAPALKRADIGIAMGASGSDVAKEASDMVLSDDNFATIVAAVEEGRVIHDNIRKFVMFSVAGNVGKILVVLLAPALVGVLPLLPLQLLWLNLLTDGLLGLGLGVAPPERDVMRRAPNALGGSVFAGRADLHLVWIGGLMGVGSLGVGYLHWLEDLACWQTELFTTLAFAQVGQALAAQSTGDSVFRSGLFANKLLASMVGIVVALQLAVVYLRPLQRVFGTGALSASDLATTVVVGGVVFTAIELEKWLRRSSRQRRSSRRALESSERADA